VRTGPVVIPVGSAPEAPAMDRIGATVPLVLPAWAIDKNIPAPKPAHYTRGGDKTAIELAREDGYKSTIPYPSRVPEPAVLRKRVSELTTEEYESIPGVNIAYAEAKHAYANARTAYNQDEARLIDLLRADLELENEMVGHPKADKLWAKVWNDRHSEGLAAVAQSYEDIVELVK